MATERKVPIISAVTAAEVTAAATAAKTKVSPT
jgi:hypothetical protein